MNTPARIGRTLAFLVAAGLLVTGAVMLLRQLAPRPGDTTSVPTPPAATAPPPAASLPPAAAGPLHPVPPSAAAGTTLADQVLQWITEPALRALLQLQDLPARLVATVDALGRDQAPVRMWPLVPAAGRFLVTPPGARQARIAYANGVRYRPYLKLLERIPPSVAARAYLAHYAELQEAYGELGFPGQYFNDRLVQVLDLLLATPMPEQPRGVHLPEIAGPPPARPWVLYAFDDPGQEKLAAGQKILLRMNRRDFAQLKDWLQKFRQQVTAH